MRTSPHRPWPAVGPARRVVVSSPHGAPGLGGGQGLRGVRGPVEPARRGGVPAVAGRAAGPALARRGLRHGRAHVASWPAATRPRSRRRPLARASSRTPGRGRATRGRASRSATPGPFPSGRARRRRRQRARAQLRARRRPRAVAEFARVIRPAGSSPPTSGTTPAAWQLMRHFWDAAAELDPAAAALDEGARFPICRPGAAAATCGPTAGLSDVAVRPIDVPTVFARLRRLLDAVPRRAGPRPRVRRLP